MGAEYLVAALYLTAGDIIIARQRKAGNDDQIWLGVAACVQALAEMFYAVCRCDRYLQPAGACLQSAGVPDDFTGPVVRFRFQAPFLELERKKAHLKTLVTSIPDLRSGWKDQHGVYLSWQCRF